MPIPYEEAARKVHPSASNFSPVYRGALGKRLCGWVFEIREGDRSHEVYHGWVTCEGTASSDKLEFIEHARRNLKAYTKPMRQVPSVYRTGEATASGPNSSANTGITFDK